MQLTVTCGLTGMDVFRLEVNNNMEMENFIALCQFEVAALANIPVNTLSLIHNGRIIQMSAENLKKTISDLGINDNDMILINANKPTTSAGQGRSQADLISSLVKGISVPKAGSQPQQSLSALRSDELQRLQPLFDSLKVNAQHREQLRSKIPQMITAAEQNNFDAFCKAYLVDRDQTVLRKRAMLDPTNAEGQRLIAEEIERSNIEHSHQFAMEHMPEAYIPVTMLYIRMKINGIEVKTFVDSGAQVSILSETIAKRCNLMRLVDTRFRPVVHGVGGQQIMVGKIHACQVQIEDQFYSCNFDVLADRDIDVLLGLDILKRHSCIIDLPGNCLRFSGSAVAKFLPDSEVPIRHLDGLGIPTMLDKQGPSNDNVEVDSSKLATLLGLGVEEAAARAMLIECGNDLQAAAARLISDQTSNS